MRSILLPFLLLPAFFLQAQNTIALGDASPPKATLEDISWLAGHWRGEAMDGQTEEIWSSPFAGSLMGSFKMVMKGEGSFYELMHIQERNGSLYLQIRHFNPDFTAWETQNESQDFPLAKIERNKAYFDGFIFEKVSKRQIKIHVLMEAPKELTFNYTRFAAN